MHRLLRAIREVAPFMLLASVGCFLAAMAVGFSWILEDRTVADRMLVALGWAGFGGIWFVAAYLSERYG